MIAQDFLASFSFCRVDVFFGFVDIDIHQGAIKVEEGSAIIILLSVEFCGGILHFWNRLWVSKERFIEIVISLCLLFNSRLNSLLNDLVHFVRTSSELTQVAWTSVLVLLGIVLTTGVLGGSDLVVWVNDVSRSSLIFISVDVRVRWVFSSIDDNLITCQRRLIPSIIRRFTGSATTICQSVRSSSIAFNTWKWCKWWDIFAFSSQFISLLTSWASFANSHFGELFRF